MATGLSISSYISQVVAGQPRKPTPIHDALQAIQNWASAGLVDGDIAAGAGIQMSKTTLGTYTTPTDWTPGYTGFSANPTSNYAKYMVIGKVCIVWYSINASGTSNSANFTITGLPIASAAGLGANGLRFMLGGGVDNTSASISTVIGSLPASSTVLTIFKDAAGTAWTAANGKYVHSFCIAYPID